jgi:LysR family pca operon transcriptional activator
MDRAALISRRLKLRHLNVLIEVVEQGSMAKAAKRLATSQPFVSKAMADLERMFGRRLLIRCGRWSSRRSGAAGCASRRMR